MKRHHWLVAMGVVVASAGVGRGQTVGDRVGEGLDTAGQAVRGGLQTAGQAVRGGLQTAGQAVRGGMNTARASVVNMEVVNRVYSRLHWEKALATSTLDLEVRAGGIVVLTGVVPTKEAKAKALTLAADTIGVVQVVDQVSIVPPGAAPAPATIVPGTPPTVIETTPPPAVIESTPSTAPGDFPPPRNR